MSALPLTTPTVHLGETVYFPQFEAEKIKLDGLEYVIDTSRPIVSGGPPTPSTVPLSDLVVREKRLQELKGAAAAASLLLCSIPAKRSYWNKGSTWRPKKPRNQKKRRG